MTVDSTSTANGSAKAALRRRIRATRRERLPHRDVETEALALAGHVTGVVTAHTNGRVCRVAAYEALPSEPPTRMVVERLTAAGYEVVVPVTLDDLDLDWRVAGTRELLGRRAIADCEVVVAPALAVDRVGHRLGQGGGSYDRALARRHSGALVVALLHDGELLPAGAVPVDPHDVSVDVVVTPSRGAVRLPSA